MSAPLRVDGLFPMVWTALTLRPLTHATHCYLQPILRGTARRLVLPPLPGLYLADFRIGSLSTAATCGTGGVPLASGLDWRLPDTMRLSTGPGLPACIVLSCPGPHPVDMLGATLWCEGIGAAAPPPDPGSVQRCAACGHPKSMHDKHGCAVREHLEAQCLCAGFTPTRAL